jgi:uroporphyrin-3 C-methyltransferase
VNNKVDETAEVKVAEQAAAGIAEEAGTDVTEETSSIDAGTKPETADSTSAGKRRSGGRPWGIILFLIVLLLVTAGTAGYFIYDLSKARKASEAELQSQAARLDELQQGTAALAENTRLLDNRLTSTNEQLAGILHNLNSLYRQGNNDIAWQLAELKYLFLIASHRLALAGDVDTAQAILQSADARLREIADPGLIPVREQLIADINRLSEFPRTDYSGLALVLGDLARRVDRLPLNLGETGAQTSATADEEPAGSGNNWQRLARGLWQELKSLLVISRTDKNNAALLAPQERNFLYQNLRLQLEAARLALLSRDDGQFRESVNACADWLNEYFDSADERVRNALTSLERAAAVGLHEAVPSIDATLRIFDEYLTRQGGTVTGDGALQ